MPFHMTHLLIGRNIHLKLPDKIKNLPQFYLGNIAPDAVHNRENYKPEYKQASHLCVGNESWGMAENNEEWAENVLKFMRSNINSEHHDFVLGYCCHILADIYNNIAVWTPFRLKYPEEFAKGYGGLYHHECDKVDIELGLINDNKDYFLVHLEKAIPMEFNNIVFAEDMKKHKENIIKRYINREHPDLSANRLVTVSSTMKFIEDATCFILNNIINIV
mgnify:FL=1